MSTLHTMEYTNKSGFVVLFTVLVTSIVLAIALALANVSYRETLFGIQARDSHIAFFAADTGLECGLYWDRMSASPFLSHGQPVTTTVSIDCAGQTISANPISSLATSEVIYKFTLPLPDTSLGISVRPMCALITVTKNIVDPNNANSVGTRVDARGYNSDCSQTASASGRIVERFLTASYAVVTTTTKGGGSTGGTGGGTGGTGGTTGTGGTGSIPLGQ